MYSHYSHTFSELSHHSISYTGLLGCDHTDGIITEEDLAVYITKVKEPLTNTLDHGTITMYTPRPPASGAVLNFIMKVLDGQCILMTHCVTDIHDVGGIYIPP